MFTVFSGRFVWIDKVVSSPLLIPLWLSKLALSPATKRLASEAWNIGSVSVKLVIYPASFVNSEILSPDCKAEFITDSKAGAN